MASCLYYIRMHTIIGYLNFETEFLLYSWLNWVAVLLRFTYCIEPIIILVATSTTLLLHVKIKLVKMTCVSC